MEREPDGVGLDASYPESGSRLCPPNEDDEQDDPGEDDGTGENSLGFLERHPSVYGMGRDQSGCQDQQLLSAGLGGDREGEHDGAEPDDADNEPSAGFDQGHGADEPNLGWTVDGCIGHTPTGRDELELAEPTGTPQDRTTLPATFTVENRYCGRRTILGLSEPQQEAFKARMPRDGEISVY